MLRNEASFDTALKIINEIRGLASTLRSNPTLGPDARRAGLEAIERSAVKASGVVDGLLLASQIDAGVRVGRVVDVTVADERAATVEAAMTLRELAALGASGF